MIMRKILNMIVTDEDRGNEPFVIRITEEQKRLIEILYDNDMLHDSLVINFLDELPIISAIEE